MCIETRIKCWLPAFSAFLAVVSKGFLQKKVFYTPASIDWGAYSFWPIHLSVRPFVWSKLKVFADDKIDVS